MDPKTQVKVMKIRNVFRRLDLSAIAPIIGDTIATNMAVTDTALDHRVVPIISFSAIALVK